MLCAYTPQITQYDPFIKLERISLWQCCISGGIGYIAEVGAAVLDEPPLVLALVFGEAQIVDLPHESYEEMHDGSNTLLPLVPDPVQQPQNHQQNYYPN